MNITNIFKQYDTGIVLSGGAVRGFAHLGVLKALHERYNTFSSFTFGFT